MRKETLSLALALALCLGLTVPAFAEEDSGEFSPNVSYMTMKAGETEVKSSK